MKKFLAGFVVFLVIIAILNIALRIMAWVVGLALLYCLGYCMFSLYRGVYRIFCQDKG